MPFRPLVRAARVLVRRIESIVTRRPYVAAGNAARRGDGAATAAGHGCDGAPAATQGRHGLAGRDREPRPARTSACWMGLYRRLAIPLQIRSHRRNARKATPRGDLVHGMAFMGIPVALIVGKRDGVPVVYDARDIHLDARNIARMGRPARWLLGRTERGWAEAVEPGHHRQRRVRRRARRRAGRWSGRWS